MNDVGEILASEGYQPEETRNKGFIYSWEVFLAPSSRTANKNSESSSPASSTCGRAKNKVPCTSRRNVKTHTNLERKLVGLTSSKRTGSAKHVEEGSKSAVVLGLLFRVRRQKRDITRTCLIHDKVATRSRYFVGEGYCSKFLIDFVHEPRSLEIDSPLALCENHRSYISNSRYILYPCVWLVSHQCVQLFFKRCSSTGVRPVGPGLG